jgi:hypothetical protein
MQPEPAQVGCRETVPKNFENVPERVSKRATVAIHAFEPFRLAA